MPRVRRQDSAGRRLRPAPRPAHGFRRRRLAQQSRSIRSRPRGTSGMKAAMNGVVNLSVLDGWWGEGYDGTNGWAIKPAAAGAGRGEPQSGGSAHACTKSCRITSFRFTTSASACGYSPEWVKLAKRSISSSYAALQFRAHAGRIRRAIAICPPRGRDGSMPRTSSRSRARLPPGSRACAEAWPGVTIRRLDMPKKRIDFGDSVRIEATLSLNHLNPEDVAVELLMSRTRHAGRRRDDELPLRRARRRCKWRAPFCAGARTGVVRQTGYAHPRLSLP